MFKKLVKKLIAAACVVGMTCAITLSSAACNIETAHPKVRISVEFNEVVYELDYTLYRDMYPNTVRHFIELSESGFYNDVLIHNYRTSDWFSGGYSYNADDYAHSSAVQAYADYLENHSKESEYSELVNDGTLTPTVFAKTKYDDSGKEVIDSESALPTLVGEFDSNKFHEIENGALNAEMGVLKMFYYEKSATQKAYVRFENDQPYMRDYKYNCATSVFAMQVGASSSYSEDKYCVFGKMDSTSALTDLIDAIDEYFDGSVTSVSANDVNVDNYENFSEKDSDRGIEVDFVLPSQPIVIKTIKVIGY